MVSKRFVCSIVVMLTFASVAFTGGTREEGGRVREAPRLEEAKPNIASDLDGYVIRTATHWPAPSPDSIVGGFVLSVWAEVEEEYNAVYRWIQMPNPSSTIEKLTATVLLGEPFADIVWIRPSDAIPALVEANMILPLDVYIDFDDPRWPRQNRQISARSRST